MKTRASIPKNYWDINRPIKQLVTMMIEERAGLQLGFRLITPCSRIQELFTTAEPYYHYEF